MVLKNILGGGVIDPLIDDAKNISPSTLALAIEPSLTTVTSGGARFGINADSLYAAADDRAVFNFADNDFWIEAWVRPTSIAAGTETIMGQFDTGADERSYMLGRNAANIVAAVSSDGTAGTTTTVTSSVTMLAQNWYHVALFHDKTTNELTLYVNGVADVAAHSGGAHNSTAQFTIFCDLNSGAAANFWGGEIAIAAGGKMAAVWGTTYTIAEVHALLKGSAHRGKHHSQLTSAQQTAIGVVADAGTGFWYECDEATGTETRMIDACNAAETSRGFDSVVDVGYILDGNQSGLDIATPTLTMAAWVRKDNTTNLHAIMGKGVAWSAGNPGYMMAINVGGTIRMSVRDAADAGGVNISVSGITAGTWHHVAAVLDGSTIKYYIDGAYLTGEDDNITAVTGSIDNAAQFCLGATSLPSHRWGGRIQDAAIWSDAKSAATVAKMYASGVPGDTDWTDSDLTTNRVSHWPCNEKVQGAGITDSDGNNNLSNSGSIQVTPGVTSTHACPADGAAPNASTGIGAGFGRNVQLAGTEYFQAPDDVRHQPEEGSFTWLFHFNCASTHATENRGIISKGTASNQSSYNILALNDNNNNLLRGVVTDGTNAATASSTASCVVGQDHTGALVLDRDAQTLTIYLDGVAGTPVPTNDVGSVGTEADGFKIGTSRDVSFEFDGVISRVSLVKGTAYTAAQVETWSNGIDPLAYDEFADAGLPVPTVAYDLDDGASNAVEVVGAVAGAAHFDSSDFLTHTDHADFRGGQSWSWAGWVNPDNSSNKGLFAKDDGAASGVREYNCRRTSGAKITIQIFDGTNDDLRITLTSAASVPINTWSFVAVRYDHGTETAGISIDGAAFEVSSAASATPGSSAAGFVVGALRDDGSVNWGGGMASVQWYTGKAMSDVEVAALYNTSTRYTTSDDLSAGQKTNLTSFWPMTHKLNGNLGYDDYGTHNLTDNGDVLCGNGPNGIDAIQTSGTIPQAAGPGVPGNLPITDGDTVSVVRSSLSGKQSFSQSDISKQCIYVASGMNSLPVLRFDGTNDLLVRSLADLLTGTAGTVIAVVAQASYTNANQVILASSDEASSTRHLNLQTRESGNNQISVWQRNADTLDKVRGDSTILDDDTVIYILVWSSDDTTYTFRVNGTAQSKTVTSGNDPDLGEWFGDSSARDNIVIGAQKYSSEVNWFPGDIAALYAWDGTALSVADVQSVEAFLATKYGVAI